MMASEFDLSVQLPAIIVALASFLVVFAVAQMIVGRKRALVPEDEWRDPPPLLFKMFKPIIRLLAPEVKKYIGEERERKVTNRLAEAGLTYSILAEEFVLLKFLCCILGGCISVWLLNENPEVGPEIYVFVVTFAPVGFFYPDLWLSDRATRRRRTVMKEFPFLLDLLVLGMRAGLNYSGSLAHAIDALPKGAIREEFNKLLREIRAGKSRREALLALGERMNLESVNNFVAAVNQAEETGGEIVDVLVAQAEQRRSERFNSAETQANKAPVRMLIPMMLFLFPIVFMLLGFIIIVKMSEIGMVSSTLTSLLKV